MFFFGLAKGNSKDAILKRFIFLFLVYQLSNDIRWKSGAPLAQFLDGAGLLLAKLGSECKQVFRWVNSLSQRSPSIDWSGTVLNGGSGLLPFK